MDKNIVIFDLDGTLANGKHRNHLVPKPEDAHTCGAWRAHFEASWEDTPILDTIAICNALGSEYKVVILTGRCVEAKAITCSWLVVHGVYYDELVMRPIDDERPDTEYKADKLAEIGVDNILCCFDDLEHVATMMRGLGLTCYLVNKYNKKRVNTTHNDEWGDLDGKE